MSLTRRAVLTRALAAPFLLVGARGAHAAVAPGDSALALSIAGQTFNVFLHRPPNYADGPLLVVLHGVERNAARYRDLGRLFGARYGMLVMAPEFERERFPNRRYQAGGIVRTMAEAEGSQPSGQQAEKDWTVSLIPQLVEAVGRELDRPNPPYLLIGHSAGGQFAQKVAAFAPGAARRIVAANPGTHVFPTFDLPYPFGFGGLTPPAGGEEGLRRYLAAPLTFYQGTYDTTADKDFNQTHYANQQGSTRYERGRKCFALGEALARSKGWPFHWRLVEASGVAHNAERMFLHPSSAAALGVSA